MTFEHLVQHRYQMPYKYRYIWVVCEPITILNPQLNFSFDVEDGVLKELSDSTDESYELTISTDVANGVKVVVKANTYSVGSFQKY